MRISCGPRDGTQCRRTTRPRLTPQTWSPGGRRRSQPRAIISDGSRLEMSTPAFASTADVCATGPLYALAQSLGAGGDLLASQNGSTCAALEDQRSLVAARSEVASITA